MIERELLQWLMMLEADVEVRRRWMKMRVEMWAYSEPAGGGAGRRQFKPKKLIAVYEREVRMFSS